jgi:hypothetical protein
LRIGTNSTNEEFFKGKIDDIRIYGRALSGAEVTELHQQEQASLNTGLVAYYPFSGNANDESGNGNHATAQNNPQYPDDPAKGRCASLVNGGFSGSGGSHFQLPDLPVTNWQAITMSMWINEVTINTASHGEFYLNLGSGNSSVFYIESSGNPTTFNYPGISHGSASAYRNKWTHHVVTIDESGSKAYINGVQVGTKAQAGLYASLAAQYTAGRSAIGRHWWSGGGATSTRFTGKIDDVRIYNRSLSAAEVIQLHNLEK